MKVNIMYKKKWQDLKKCIDYFELEPEASSKTQCSARINFTHAAFDCHEEFLVAADTAGYIYYVDLSNNCPSYQKLGNVGQATFVAFNPMNKFEILVGLTTADIKIIRVNINFGQFCALIAHKVPPIHISFYKKYCLTCSHKEVIIWCLQSYSKVQQLRACTKNIMIKKAIFSNLGHIVVLYQNDTVQAWNFNELENDVKIYAKTFGIRDIKDFVFTRNGRAMIVTSTQNKIVILNTCNWTLMKTLNLPENFIGIKQLSIVPIPLDGGANKILACVSSSALHFLDLSQSCIINTMQPVRPIKKIVVSPTGRYIAYIEIEGHIKIVIAEKLFAEKCEPSTKIKPCRLTAHTINDHLECVKKLMKNELHLKRLIPILKEFGEYPEKYRVLIWSTILKLPGNKIAYNTLANKAANSNFTSEFLKNYPLASRSKVILLSTTVNCLIHWCPLLVQCSFLPNLVFPFLIVFQKDILLGFELILTILLNYCQKWFEYHPLPPLNVLGIIENILLHANPSLLKIFCKRGITSSEYAWPLLKTMLSEVLSGPEWLILWDHLISYQKPSLLLMSVVAYSICSHEIIISSLTTPESIKRYFNTQGHIRAKELLNIAHKLDNNVPLRIHPSHYLRNELIPLPLKGPYPPFMLNDFPKFLADDISILELKRQKEKEEAERECNRRTVEMKEKKRLQHEAKAFRDQIHQARMNEVEQCIKEQLSDMDWKFRTKMYPQPEETGDKYTCEQFHSVPLLDIATSADEECNSIKDEKTKRCEQLQHDVDQLEHEVQTLLNSLRSPKTKDAI